jgi:pimeloyl-ACP methyl ester carboxylesterase
MAAERFLLLHGAGTGGWLWDPVRVLLEADGHTVVAPTLSGVAERASEGGPGTNVTTHVAEATAHLSVREPTTVVGFSYSGVVASRLAAEQPDRVGRVVLVDAFLPVPGRSFLELLPPPVADRLTAAATEHGDGWKLPPLPVAAVGGVGSMEEEIDPATVDAALDRRGVHPLGTYLERAEPSWLVPASKAVRYVSCTVKNDGDPLLAIAANLRAAGGDVVELPTGHFCMLTMPRALTRALCDHAE